jgi:hypothetical protein
MKTNSRESFEGVNRMELTGIQWQVFVLGCAQSCCSAAMDFEIQPTGQRQYTCISSRVYFVSHNGYVVACARVCSLFVGVTDSAYPENFHSQRIIDIHITNMCKNR